MPALIVPIADIQSDDTRSGRETRLREKFGQAYCAAARLVSSGPAREALGDVHVASEELRIYFDRRAHRAEKLLRRVLDAVPLSPEMRADVFGVVVGRGKAARLRDSTVLTDNEQKLVANYRAMDAADRQAVRTVFDRFAERSVRVDDAEQNATEGGRR